MSEGGLYGTVHNLVAERVFSSVIEHRLPAQFIYKLPARFKRKRVVEQNSEKGNMAQKSREEAEREMRE